MNQSANFDASIPLLTEVLQPAGGAAVPGAPADAAPAQLEALARRAWSGQDWQVLEERLAERILQQVQGSLSQMLEQALGKTLRHALDQLGGELRRDLHHTVERAVSEAVRHELADLPELKR